MKDRIPPLVSLALLTACLLSGCREADQPLRGAHARAVGAGLTRTEKPWYLGECNEKEKKLRVEQTERPRVFRIISEGRSFEIGGKREIPALAKWLTDSGCSDAAAVLEAVRVFNQYLQRPSEQEEDLLVRLGFPERLGPGVIPLARGREAEYLFLVRLYWRIGSNREYFERRGLPTGFVFYINTLTVDLEKGEVSQENLTKFIMTDKGEIIAEDDKRFSQLISCDSASKPAIL